MGSNHIYLVTEDPENYPYWDKFATLEECIEYCDQLPILFCDTESTGLTCVMDEMHCIQLGDKYRQFVVDWRWKQKYLKSIKKLLEKQNMTLVFHNAVHDIPFLYNEQIKPRIVHDTLVAEKCLTLGLLVDRSLAGCLRFYLGIEVPKEEQGLIARAGLSSRRLIQYSGDDIYYLHLLYDAQKEYLDHQGHWRQVELVSQFTRVLAYIEWCGFHLNTDKFMNLVERSEAEHYYAKEKLNSYMEEHYPEVFNRDINWSSPKQVTTLFEGIGVDCTNPKDDTKKTSDIKVLARQKDQFEFLELYEDMSKKSTTVTNFGRNWLDAVHPDKRIHTKFNPLVSTGRTSCGASKLGVYYKNLQNVSSVEGLRECFQAYGATKLINCDYSSQESVLFADQCQDPKLLEFWQSNQGDMHSYTARLLWPEKLGKLSLDEIKRDHAELRRRAKSAGFAIQYGSKGWSIAQTLNIPEQEATDLYERYMKAYRGMSKYFQRVQDQSFKDGYITINAAYGAKRYFDHADILRDAWRIYRLDPRTREVDRETKRVLNGIARQALNSPTQGTAALMSMKAGVDFLDWIFYEEKGFKTVKIVNFVHDEYVAEASNARVERVEINLKEKMEGAAEEFLTTLKMRAEPVSGRMWNH